MFDRVTDADIRSHIDKCQKTAGDDFVKFGSCAVKLGDNLLLECMKTKTLSECGEEQKKARINSRVFEIKRKIDSAKARVFAHPEATSLKAQKADEDFFFSDKKISESQDSFTRKFYEKMGQKFTPKPWTKDELRTYRKNLCTYTYDEQGYSSNKILRACNSLLGRQAPDIPELNLAGKPPKVQDAPKASADVHKECLEAKDYEGCVRVRSSKSKPVPKSDKCSETGLCRVQIAGKDIFGMKKPMGWFYIEAEDGSRINYFSPLVYRVPHKGQPDRYLARPELVRYYQNPKAGSSGSVIGGGSASTNCVDLGGSISCTTTQSPSTYIPGRAATPGGVRSIPFTLVADCKDKTFTTYESRTDGKPDFRWRDATNGSRAKSFIEVWCPKRSAYPVLEMKL